MPARDNIDRAGNDAAARDLLGTNAPDEASVSPGHATRGVAGVDPLTGEVVGAGSGTGGGNPGEDFDDDHTAGSNTAR